MPPYPHHGLPFDRALSLAPQHADRGRSATGEASDLGAGSGVFGLGATTLEALRAIAVAEASRRPSERPHRRAERRVAARELSASLPRRRLLATPVHGHGSDRRQGEVCDQRRHPRRSAGEHPQAGERMGKGGRRTPDDARLASFRAAGPRSYPREAIRHTAAAAAAATTAATTPPPSPLLPPRFHLCRPMKQARSGRRRSLLTAPAPCRTCVLCARRGTPRTQPVSGRARLSAKPSTRCALCAPRQALHAPGVVRAGEEAAGAEVAGAGVRAPLV